MVTPRANLHHVVFVMARERLDAAADYLGSLGFEFMSFDHEELGLAIRLDWDGGIELIAPLPDAPTGTGTAAEFLARNGEGVFSVVMRVPDMAAAEKTAERHGARVDFRQEVDTGESRVVEVKYEPLFGIPVTLLETDL